MTILDIPPGFEPIEGGGPFIDLFSTFFFRHGERGPIVGMRVVNRLLNPWDMMHGGALATFADMALGFGVARSAGTEVRRVTAALHLDYMEAAREGDWIEAHIVVQKRGRNLVFAHCDVRAGTREILHASAIFSASRESAPKGIDYGQSETVRQR